MQVCVEHVFKRFGSETVLSDVCATFEGGRIYGIIGRNGCSKTERAIRTGVRIGAIIEAPGFPGEYSGRTNLSLLAGLKGLATRQDIDSAMHRVGLNPATRKHVGKYSMGMCTEGRQ